MLIRKANENDILEISKLYILNWKNTYSGMLSQKYLDGLSIEYGIKKWKNYMNEEGTQIFVAYEEDKFLGFTASKTDTDEDECWYLDSLHVKQSLRGKGIGRKLINTVGKYAINNGYKRMSICIVKGNNNAKCLYESLGAIHYKDFIDDFGGIKSNSEKLIWNDLNVFI